MRYTEKEILEQVEKEKKAGTWNKSIEGIPSIVAGKNSSNKPTDWYKKEDTPEANEEHVKRCYASLEQKGKLRMPDKTKGDKKIGENKDYKEYADRP